MLAWNILYLPPFNSTPLVLNVDWLTYVELMLGDNILCLQARVIFGQLSISWERDWLCRASFQMLGSWTPVGKIVSPVTEQLLSSSAVLNKIQNQVSHSPGGPNCRGNSYLLLEWQNWKSFISSLALFLIVTLGSTELLTVFLFSSDFEASLILFFCVFLFWLYHFEHWLLRQINFSLPSYEVLWWVPYGISGWHIILNRLSAFKLRDYNLSLKLVWYRLYPLKLVEDRI